VTARQRRRLDRRHRRTCRRHGRLVSLLFLCRPLGPNGRPSRVVWLRSLIEACRLRLDRESERLYGPHRGKGMAC